MATTAHALYCFEILSASLQKQEAFELGQVQALWAQYQSVDEKDDESDDGLKAENLQEPHGFAPSKLQLPNISRIQASSPATASTASTPSSLSTTSSQVALDSKSKSSSKSSFFSFSRGNEQPSSSRKEEQHPLFVTWNTVSTHGHTSLRGCIGTFDAQELSNGLKSYALTAAFDDTRFPPITLSELPTLSCSVTLLTNFTPVSDPLDWNIGTHGLRISFSHHGRRYGSTYLPDVALEQGWTKEETLVSLMRKGGWSGKSKEWRAVKDLKVVRYEGTKQSVRYEEWREWKEWIEEVGS